jgi:hypothetical protein
MHVNIIMLKKMEYASFNQTQYQSAVFNSTSTDSVKNVQQDCILIRVINNVSILNFQDVLKKMLTLVLIVLATSNF